MYPQHKHKEKEKEEKETITTIKVMNTLIHLALII
jgi:hypothetical protein